MALSGSVQGVVTKNSNYYTYHFDWSATQDIASNTSTITVRHYWKNYNGYDFDTVGARNYGIVIDGQPFTGSKRFDYNPWPADPTISTATHTVKHNDDGTKRITISTYANGTASSSSGSWGPSSSTAESGNCTASVEITLDSIPRAASLLSAPNFNVWENPTVTYSNPAGNAADVQISIHNPEGNYAYAGYRSMPRTGTSYTLSLTDAERNAITNAVPNGANTMYVTFYIRTVINGSTVSGSIRGLTRIVTVKRGATITSAPNFTDEDNPTISYSNPGGNTVGDLQAGIYDVNGAITYAGYRSISKTGSSYTFNLTADERQRLINAIPNGKTSTTVRFYLATTIDGSVYSRNTINKTLTITNATPSISCEVKDVGSASTQLTNDPNVIIKGFNYVTATMTPTLKKRDGINSKSIVNGGQTSYELSANFENTENGVFTFNLVDSFGQPVTKQVTLDVIPYVKLTCDIETNKPSPDGNTSFIISGNYFNNKFGQNGDQNALTIKWRIKENSGEYGEWFSVTPILKDSSYETTVNLTGLDYKSSYTVQAIASDLINTSGITSAEKVIKSFPVFNWGEDNFDINVPLRVDDITCKTNICDGQLELGSYNNENGEKMDNVEGWINYRSVNPTEVEPSTSYVFYVNDYPQKQVVLYYDENHSYIAEDRGVIGDGIFTTPPGTKYITFRCFAADYTDQYQSLKIELFKLSPIKTKTINGSGIYGSGDMLVGNPGITLYENTSGTTGTITLSDNVDNYECIEILYKDDHNHFNSCKVPKPYNKYAFLINAYLTSSTSNVKLTHVLISGTTISHQFGSDTILGAGATVSITAQDYGYIVKVVGILPKPITYIDGNGVKY